MFDIDVSPHTLTSARVFHNNERTPYSNDSSLPIVKVCWDSKNFLMSFQSDNFCDGFVEKYVFTVYCKNGFKNQIFFIILDTGITTSYKYRKRKLIKLIVS